MDKVFYIDNIITKAESSKGSEGLNIAGYANTTDKDRQGDVVLASAWAKGIDNYRTNPVLLFQHNANTPIGRVNKIRVDHKGLYVDATISSAAEKNHGIQTLVRDGALKSFSVGFRVKDQNLDQNSETSIITELELLEISVVSIPANQTSLFSVRKSFDNQEDYKSFCESFSAEKEDKEILHVGTTDFIGDHYHSFELIGDTSEGRTSWTSHGVEPHTHTISNKELHDHEGHTHTIRITDVLDDKTKGTVENSSSGLIFEFDENSKEKTMATDTIANDAEVEIAEELSTKEVLEPVVEKKEAIEEEKVVKDDAKDEDLEADDNPYEPIPFENHLNSATSRLSNGSFVNYKGSRWKITKIATTDSPRFNLKEVDINGSDLSETLSIDALSTSIINEWDVGSAYDVILDKTELSLELTETLREEIKKDFKELATMSELDLFNLKSLNEVESSVENQKKLNKILNLKSLSTSEWTDTNFVAAKNICSTITKLLEVNKSDERDLALMLAGYASQEKNEMENKENTDMATQSVGEPIVLETQTTEEEVPAPVAEKASVQVSEPRVEELVKQAGAAAIKNQDAELDAAEKNEVHKELEELRALKADLAQHRDEVIASKTTKMQYHENNSNLSAFSQKDMADAYMLASIKGPAAFEATKMAQRMKAVITGNSLQTSFSEDVQKEMEQELVIWPMLRTIDVDGKNFDIPVSDEDVDLNVAMFPSGTFVTGVGDTTNVPTSYQNLMKVVSHTPHKFMVTTHLPKDEAEDSLVPLLPFLREGASRRLARSIDRSFLRGDGTISGFDATIASATGDMASVITGIVARCNDVASDGLKVFTGANATTASALNIATARGKMGKYGLNVASDDLVYVTTVEGYNELVQTADFRTVDTFGDQATYHKGTVGAIWGIPVVVSEFMTDKGATTTANNSVGVLFHKPSFVVTQRRGIEVESEYLPRQQVTGLYMSARVDMHPLTTVSTAGALSTTYSMGTVIQTGTGVDPRI
jgi:HK97 family phage prohead protease/HK97 family phage major capsid protein